MNRPVIVAAVVVLFGGCAASKGGADAANGVDGSGQAGDTGSAGTTATGDASISDAGTGGTSATGAAGSADAGTAGAAGAGTGAAGAADTDPAIACQACELSATTGATCFQTSSTANPDTTDPMKFGCNGFSAVDQAECKALIACIRTNHCGKSDDATPCLCGVLDPTTCASTAIASLTGACRDQYVAAADGGNVFSLFFSTDSPIGIANNLFTCDVDASCACQ
jgi:hypothetical protein